MVYVRSALAELNTYNAHDLSCFSISSSKRSARGRCSRKFSSMMKKPCTFMAASNWHMIENSSSPVS